MAQKREPSSLTDVFGYIAFGKDGSVRKHVEKLPSKKSEREPALARRFAEALSKSTGIKFEAIPLPENDNDFQLHTEGKPDILVESTSIVSRDYLRPITKDDYLKSRHNFSTVMLGPDDTHCGVDEAAKEAVLLERVKGKLRKNYGRRGSPFWLLIWTAAPLFDAFWVEDRKHRTSEGVVNAREYLKENGAGSFDEIWFFDVNGSPKRIWPND